MEIQLKSNSALQSQREDAKQIQISSGEGSIDLKHQGDSGKLSRLLILRCGIVMLQNFTEDIAEPGRQFQLLREPDNIHDRWATRVCTLSGTMLGYLPSGKNQSLARLMDAGKKITVFVDEEFDASKKNPEYTAREDDRLPLALYMDVQLP